MPDSPGSDYGNDGRSSSLSELDDPMGNDQPPIRTESSVEVETENENDSEAETERLEISPIKLRKRRDVIVSSDAQQTFESSPIKPADRTTPELPTT